MRRRTKDPRDRQGYNLGARYLVFLVITLGMFAYLLGLQYKYKNDTRKSKKYLKEALQKLKGTPYEEEIRGLLSESAE